MRSVVLFLVLPLSLFVKGQDTLTEKKSNPLNSQMLLSVNTAKQYSDSTSFKTPVYRQGFFCNFEDQLNRKKVPIDFSLGKSKY